MTTEDGTGIVHLAPAFGEDDYRVAAAAPEVPFDPDPRGDAVQPGAPRRHLRRARARPRRALLRGALRQGPAADEELIEDLRARGLLLRGEAYEHSYPHCWRCGTPLIYYAKPSWYIATSTLREELLAANETVDWHPPHVKHGRFGDWLKNNVDWALSRERYWGTPLPVWRCGEGHVHVIGSFAELAERSGTALADHHRPFVDEVAFPCPHEDGGERCGQPMSRVPEVIDVWFDSGAMPFAQHPLSRSSTRRRFERRFPADFICEAQDQTRGWFYSLLAVSTLLDRGAPYRNVVCLGLILDEDGQKMSKSKGNTVEPWQVLDELRRGRVPLVLLHVQAAVGRLSLLDGRRSARACGCSSSSCGPRTTSTSLYAQASARAAGGPTADAPPADDLDRWALSRTAATAELVAERLDAYDATTAGRAIAELVDELSNWYVRRSRRRFWDGDPAAFTTLRTCLLDGRQAARAVLPVHRRRDLRQPRRRAGERAPVRLPRAAAALPPRDERARAGDGAGAGDGAPRPRRARARRKIKVRQPLGEAVVVAAGREREAIERPRRTSCARS